MTKITRPTTGALPLNLATAFAGMLFLFVLVTTEAPTTTTTKPGLAFTGIDVPRQLTSMLLLFATGGLFLALVRRRILRGH